MGAVKARHFAGVVLGALAAFVVIIGFIAVYSVMNGSAPLSPFQGANTIGPFTGTTATEVLVFLDFLIPLVAGTLFLAISFVISRSSLSALGLTSPIRALAQGALLGLAVFFLFYIPVLYTLAHPTLARAVQPLLQGLVDHLAFGSVLVLVVYLVGGPIPTAPRTQPTPLAPDASRSDRAPP